MERAQVADDARRTLADAIVAALGRSLRDSFPSRIRSPTLISVADFSGTHRDSKLATYAFLLIDRERNQHWFDAQQIFREGSISKRRISFKKLNDNNRQRNLPEFLKMANSLVGALIVIAIPNDFGSLFESETSQIGTDDLLNLWKPKTHEHLMRVTHLGGIITAMMTAPKQSLFFIVDQDEVASNVDQLTRLTEIVSRVLGNRLEHNLGHIRVGTTQSDDGTLQLEDLASIADLAAGAAWSLLNEMRRKGRQPVHGLRQPIPQNLPEKAIYLSHWLADEVSPLRRTILLLDRDSATMKSLAKKVKLGPFFGLI